MKQVIQLNRSIYLGLLNTTLLQVSFLAVGGAVLVVLEMPPLLIASWVTPIRYSNSLVAFSDS